MLGVDSSQKKVLHSTVQKQTGLLLESAKKVLFSAICPRIIPDPDLSSIYVTGIINATMYWASKRKKSVPQTTVLTRRFTKLILILNESGTEKHLPISPFQFSLMTDSQLISLTDRGEKERHDMEILLELNRKGDMANKRLIEMAAHLKSLIKCRRCGSGDVYSNTGVAARNADEPLKYTYTCNNQKCRFVWHENN